MINFITANEEELRKQKMYAAEKLEPIFDQFVEVMKKGVIISGCRRRVAFGFDTVELEPGYLNQDDISLKLNFKMINPAKLYIEDIGEAYHEMVDNIGSTVMDFANFPSVVRYHEQLRKEFKSFLQAELNKVYPKRGEAALYINFSTDLDNNDRSVNTTAEVVVEFQGK